jgi:putative transposase
LKKAAYFGRKWFTTTTFPKEYATMRQGSIDRWTVPAPESQDVMTEILRAGAQKLLAEMIHQEVEDWLTQRAHLRDEQGRRQVVRNGYLPKREITTGVGAVEVQPPRVRDRRPTGEAEPFTSQILPPYLRKTKSMEELIPWLYLKGINTGDFSEALKALVGPDCPGLSATTVTRLKGVWEQEFQEWSQRFLAGKQCVCGRMACISTSAWKKIGNASWCSWERRPTERRN